MKSKYVLVWLMFCLIASHISSQSGVDSVLHVIERNNKTLMASRQYWEAKKLEFLTGLSLPNPTLEYEYLFGSPASAGDQTDILAVQSFELPSVYRKRRELANTQASKSIFDLAIVRQDILLDAKTTCIELSYRNKLLAHISTRHLALEKLVRDFQNKLDRGDGNVLDVNKARLQLLQTQQLLSAIEVEKTALLTHLIGLNGGERITFTDSIYPPIPDIPDFGILEKEYELNDPVRQLFENEKKISESQLALSKTWKLPKFEAGYRYQGILGQRFSGIHAGITLPLWEQKNKVKHQEAEMQFRDLQIREHLNEHYFEIKEMYDNQAAQNIILRQYRESFAGISNMSLLDKALTLGEITIIEYFLETSFYHNATLQYLETERDFHISVARLFKYKL